MISDKEIIFTIIIFIMLVTILQLILIIIDQEDAISRDKRTSKGGENYDDKSD